MVEQNFIVQIRQTEKKADDIIDAARAKSRQEIENAREKVEQMLRTARDQAEKEQTEKIAETEKLVNEIENNIAEKVIPLDDKQLDKAAATVAERIVEYCVDR